MRKPLYSEYYLKNKIRATKEALKNKKQKRLYVQTMSRRSAIRPEWLGITFLVHNGQRYVKVNVKTPSGVVWTNAQGIDLVASRSGLR